MEKYRGKGESLIRSDLFRKNDIVLKDEEF
jgi:hypothetical protein